MIIYPAIDITNGKCVRLSKGDINKKTVYFNTPYEGFKYWKRQNTKYLHIVNLDGALNIENQNFSFLKDISNSDINIQVGGGVRSYEDAKSLINMNYSVVIGTLAIKNEKLLKRLLNDFKDKIIIAVDSINGYVTTDGWVKKSKINLYEFIEYLEKLNVQKILFTDISKDGMLNGPNIEAIKYINEHFNIKLIASGGISTMDDLNVLNELNIYGVIIGKAFYENKLNFKKIMEEYYANK